MKKILLIPTTLITCLTPMVSLIGCKDNETDADEKYKVTVPEMAHAIAMEDIDYLQYTYTTETKNPEDIDISSGECAPQACHIKRSYPGQYVEAYTELNSDDPDFCDYYWRDGPQGTWDVSKGVSSADHFESPEHFGQQIYVYFEDGLRKGSNYEYDSEEKCYTTSFTYIEYEEITYDLKLTYYFEDKILKHAIVASTINDETTIYDMVLSYEEYTPERPPVSETNK